MTMRTVARLSFLASLLVHNGLFAENWPQFRGPDSSGVSRETGLPATWNATSSVAWKTPIPGRGWSSPVVWGSRVFLTTAISGGQEEAPQKGLYLGGNRETPSPNEHRWVVLCLDAPTGKIAWERLAHQGKPGGSRHIKNTHASETCATDGERVVALFGNVGVYAYSLEGKELWSRALPVYKTQDGWGTAASPVIHEGRVYIVKDNEEKSFLLCLDAKSGEEIWRVDRNERSNWATPFVWTTPQRTEIVTNGSGKIRSYGLDGKLLWELAGNSKITIPTPNSAHGLLYVASGFVMDARRPVFAIKPGASGNLTLKEGERSSGSIAWSQLQTAPYHPSTIVVGDFLYVLTDRGLLSCLDAKTGEIRYDKKRLPQGTAGFTASPWAYEGKVFCASEEGDTYVVQAGPEFKLLGTNSLGEMIMASPAISGGALYLRTLEHLYKIAVR